MKRPWGVRRVPQRSPGLAGSPEGCCGLNAREAASGLLVESGRHFDRYMEQVWIESCVSLSSSALCGALARRTVSASDARSSLRSVTPNDSRSSIRIVSHRVSSTIGIALMETSASRIEDGVCTSSSLPHTIESDTAAAALQGSPSDVAAVEQQPCVRCKTNSGKNGKHTCEKRRRTGSGPLAPSQRPRRGSAPVVHE